MGSPQWTGRAVSGSEAGGTGHEPMDNSSAAAMGELSPDVRLVVTFPRRAAL